MKRYKLLALIVGMIMLICVAFSACNALPDGSDCGDNSQQTQDGEEDNSQQTQDSEQVSEAMLMYREALAAGYEGSFLDFLEEYFKTGDQVTQPEADSISGAALAVLSVVKIQSTYKVGYTGSVVQVPRFATEHGSGVIYSLDRQNWSAYVITNYHVVYESSSLGEEKIPHISDDIKVWHYGGELESGKLSATFVGGAIDYDVAVLYIDGAEIVYETDGGQHTNASVLQNSAARPVTVGDSDDISVGGTVYAIGNPAGTGISVTQGIVSVKAEYITTFAIDSTNRTVDFLVMRIDAAVNHGNSGGGLFNSRGEYIGTVNARSEADGIRDFGYAIPSNLMVAVARNVIDAHSRGARRANLGITTEILSSHSVYDEATGKTDIVQQIGVKSVDQSGAVAGFLQAGDILLSVTVGENLKEITREYQLTFLLFNLRAGDTAIFEVLREGEKQTISIELKATDFQVVY